MGNLCNLQRINNGSKPSSGEALDSSLTESNKIDGGLLGDGEEFNGSRARDNRIGSSKVEVMKAAMKAQQEAAEQQIVEHRSSNPDGVTIRLLPHEHTLFCERKQRVCSAVGKLQEMEIIEVSGLDVAGVTTIDWIRTDTAVLVQSIDSGEQVTPYTVLESHRDKQKYQLQREDVGFYISLRYVTNTDNIGEDEKQSNYRFISEALGPILPGPPRMLEFVVTGNMQVGSVAQAEGHYIGGYEGQSEFWWMRISADGRRSQVTEPTPVPLQLLLTTQAEVDTTDVILSNQDGGLLGEDAVDKQLKDPRLYKLTIDDIGCTLKAKCRPVRNSDGAQGEIFTSKASERIAAALDDVATIIATADQLSSSTASNIGAEVVSDGKMKPLSVDINANAGDIADNVATGTSYSGNVETPEGSTKLNYDRAALVARYIFK